MVEGKKRKKRPTMKERERQEAKKNFRQPPVGMQSDDNEGISDIASLPTKSKRKEGMIYNPLLQRKGDRRKHRKNRGNNTEKKIRAFMKKKLRESNGLLPSR